MSEEFKPIRITLSEEAFDRLEKITKDARFRSYSSTVEECVRAVYDIIKEIRIVAAGKDDSERRVKLKDIGDSWDRIVMRLNRFTGIRVVIQPAKE